MKKILLATTAMALYSGAALAGGPTVTVGGFSDFQAGFTDQNSAYRSALGGNDRDTKFQNRTRVDVKASGRGDNGLGYGAVVQLLADLSTDADAKGVNADKTYLFLDSMFGRLELGSNTDAAQALKVDASNFARATGGIAGDWYHFANSGNTPGAIPAVITHPELPGAHFRDTKAAANKITYYTPRFQGVQVGASYTPSLTDAGTAASFVGKDFTIARDVIDAGVNYTAQYSQVGVAAAVTGEWGKSSTAGTKDISAYNLGLNLSSAGATVGGSYGNWQDSGITAGASDDNHYWTVGAGYEFGPAGVSLTYLDSQLVDNKFHNVSLGADYQLAPGLVPYVEVNFFSLKPAGTTKNDGSVVLVGTELNF